MKITFIGGGNMAQSIIGGILQSDTRPEDITVCDPNLDQLTQLKNTFKINLCQDNIQGIANANIIILAVKPQILQTVTEQLRGHLPEDAMIVSIAAGVTTDKLKNWLDTDLPIIRTMPNTPALVQQGMTGIYCAHPLNQNQKKSIDSIFNSIGNSLWVDEERNIDAITAISGSGPAYFFLFFEAVENAAKSLGLSSDDAAKLIQQTALGAATMALQSDKNSQTLKENVMSPGGTTEQAINVFTEQGFSNTIQQALEAAYQRSITLSK